LDWDDALTAFMDKKDKVIKALKLLFLYVMIKITIILDILIIVLVNFGF
jgi:hypothetical protein